MSTDFNVELSEYGGSGTMTTATLNGIKSDLGLAANSKVVFALVVVDRMTGGDRAKVRLLAGQTAHPQATANWLSVRDTKWEPDPHGGRGHSPAQRHPMRKNAANPQDPATNAFVLPSANDVLVVTYPDNEYVGFCTFVGGRWRWY